MTFFIPANPPQVQVIAHRGAPAYLPEHTLAGHAMAHAMGPDFIEPDLVLTKDNIPVVLHDIQLDDTTDVAVKFPDRRRTDGRFYAIDLTFKEIKQLRVNERISLATGTPVFSQRYPQGLSTFEVPSFEELLDLLIGLNTSTGRQIGIYPELKEPLFHQKEKKDITKIAYEMFKRKQKALGKAKLVWQCFDLETLKRLRSEFQSQEPLVFLLDEGVLELKNQEKLKVQLKDFSAVVQGIGPPFSSIFHPDGKSTGLVAAAHQNKLFVHAYTVRRDELPAYVKDLDHFHRKIFLEEKVDGVFSDFSDLTLAFLKEKGLK